MVYYNEKIWVGTNNSLFQLSQDGWTEVAGLDAVTQTKGVLDMVIGPQSRLWVLFADSVAIFEGDTFLCGDEGIVCPSLPWTPMFYEDLWRLPTRMFGFIQMWVLKSTISMR